MSRRSRQRRTHLRHRKIEPLDIFDLGRDQRLHGSGELRRTLRFRRLRLGRGPRIGVDYAGAWAKRPWRFFDRASPYVSTASARLRRGRSDPAPSTE